MVKFSTKIPPDFPHQLAQAIDALEEGGAVLGTLTQKCTRIRVEPVVM